ncbi:MAG: NPCBM/NEW2 domain-containing protein [Phycisphaerae bacterium]
MKQMDREFRVAFAWAALFSSTAMAQEPLEPATVQYVMTHAGPVATWPRLLNVRPSAAPGDELFMLALGDVQTAAADATYDPAIDRLTFKDTTSIDYYFRDRLGVKHYRMIARGTYPVPPTGWSTWYHAYHEIDAKSLLDSAAWIRQNLRPYGLTFVQLDDGWQGVGRGYGDNRDWTTINERFTDPGLGAISRKLLEQNLSAGIWIVPHGQSNPAAVEKSGAFLKKPDGTSPSDTWVGKYLIDPSTQNYWNYLRDTMQGVADQGYTLFKVDGQSIVLSELETQRSFMAGKPSDSQPSDAAELYYRSTLRAIRAGTGADAFVLGSWEVPLAGVGFFNGARTGPDVTPSYSGYLTAVDAIQRFGYLHNMVWYNDPDCLILRPPLSDGVARSWATAVGLSGQILFSGDRVQDLPAGRLDMLRRVLPATEIRPLDLFKPGTIRKPIWVLHVAQPLFNLPPPPPEQRIPTRDYTVVGVFNFDDRRSESRQIDFAKLGLDASKAYHVWDFWGQTYLGAWRDGLFIDVPPADVRVLTLMAEDSGPVALSTNRHITQGWVDLHALTRAQNGDKFVFNGKSTIVGNERYRVTFAGPRGKPYKITKAVALPATTVAPASASFVNAVATATVQIDSKYAQTLNWEVTLEPAEPPWVYPVQSPTWLRVDPEGLDGAVLTWDPQYNTKAGYQVLADDRAIGIAFHNRAVLRGLTPGKAVTFGVRSIWYDGAVSDMPAQRMFTAAPPDSIALARLTPIAAEQSWAVPLADRSVEGNVLTIAGTRYDTGVGMHGDATVRYTLHGLMKRFEALVGIDDEREAGEATFEVAGDGKVLWASEKIGYGSAPVALSVDITGVKELILTVRGHAAHANWVSARLTR